MNYSTYKKEDGFIYKEFGNNPYRLWIVIWTHWNETIWFNALELIDKEKLKDVTIVIANLLAVNLNKRFVESDLNRCFLRDWDWNQKNAHEYNLSERLNKLFSKFDYLLDIHSTPFDVKPYFIVDNPLKADKELIRCVKNTEINDVYTIPLWWTVMWSHTNGVGLEMWEDKDPIRVKQVANIITDILDNLQKDSANSYEKNVFYYKWSIKKDVIDLFSQNVKNFEEVKKWELLWYDKNNNKVYANEDITLMRVNHNLDIPDSAIIIDKIPHSP